MSDCRYDAATKPGYLLVECADHTKYHFDDVTCDVTHAGALKVSQHNGDFPIAVFSPGLWIKALLKERKHVKVPSEQGRQSETPGRVEAAKKAVRDDLISRAAMMLTEIMSDDDLQRSLTSDWVQRYSQWMEDANDPKPELSLGSTAVSQMSYAEMIQRAAMLLADVEGRPNVARQHDWLKDSRSWFDDVAPVLRSTAEANRKGD